jgi:ankyrin repeat protein
MSSGDWKELYDAACSGDLELVRYHVGAGVDVNYVHPEYSGTVLVAAILSGHAPVALFLLDRGADPQRLSALDGCTPLQAAQQVKLSAVVDRLRALRA